MEVAGVAAGAVNNAVGRRTDTEADEATARGAVGLLRRRGEAKTPGLIAAAFITDGVERAVAKERSWRENRDCFFPLLPGPLSPLPTRLRKLSLLMRVGEGGVTVLVVEADVAAEAVLAGVMLSRAVERLDAVVSEGDEK